MAAVIAKDKQKQGGSGATAAADGSHPDAAAAATGATGEAAVMVEDMPPNVPAGKAVDAVSTSNETTASESTRGKKQTAKDKDEGNKSHKANGETSEEGAKEDEEDTSAKRYRRRRCEVSGCTKFARFNNACSEWMSEVGPAPRILRASFESGEREQLPHERKRLVMTKEKKSAAGCEMYDQALAYSEANDAFTDYADTL
uniref:Uncharacterized protein n=1 Tax=Globisporangium ultimum (strain ATCC 200006 / CBS 805.95 / DAOM BR144) TaxID=431595 RepID=K3W719_GLOUD